MKEAPIHRISRRVYQKAKAIERRFRSLHGQSSIEHLADVMALTNKVIPNCECFCCAKARFIPPKKLGRKYYTRNEDQ